MASPIPTLTDQDKALAKRLHGKGRSIAGLAREFGVSTITIRRGIFPEKYQAKKTEKKREIREFAIKAQDRLMPRCRVSDVPDHPLARLIHEGPSPERRALMQEGRI